MRPAYHINEESVWYFSQFKIILAFSDIMNIKVEIEDYFQNNNILTKIKEKGAEYIKENMLTFVS